MKLMGWSHQRQIQINCIHWAIAILSYASDFVGPLKSLSFDYGSLQTLHLSVQAYFEVINKWSFFYK